MLRVGGDLTFVFLIYQEKTDEMASFESIVGKIRGKVGPVVGCQRGGVAYLRSLPSKSVNPPTEVQRANRGLLPLWTRRGSALCR